MHVGMWVVVDLWWTGGVGAGSSPSHTQADRQVQLILISQHQRRAMLMATSNRTNYSLHRKLQESQHLKFDQIYMIT